MNAELACINAAVVLLVTAVILVFCVASIPNIKTVLDEAVLATPNDALACANAPFAYSPALLATPNALLA